MKTTENTALLAHKRRVDEARKASAISKKRAANLAALRKVGGQK